ncbi:MAG: S-layer homology domain-containing protein [Ruminococcaceae bacterium]|nr:S-layer homology domain-containing protein [Oscillospiraceae bacterium]
MIKKLSAVLLAFLMILPSVGVLAFEDTDGTDYAKAVDTLEALGIVKGYEDKNFHPDDSLTRAQFAAMVVRLTDTSVYAIPEGQIFSDVNKKHWAFEYVNAGYAMGYFSGYGDGSFAPDGIITFAEAVKSMVTMLGYGNVAEAYGGYPHGYIKVANSEKLLTGISGYDSNTINRGDVALLIYNCLDKPMLIQTSFGGETERYEPDSSRTILTEGLGCNKYEGSVEANKITGINGFEALGTDEVLIGGNKFLVGKSGIEDYIGYELEVYVKEDKFKDEKTVIFFDISDETRVINVSPDNINPSTNLRNFVYEEGDKTKTLALSYDVQVIVNSKNDPFFTVADLTPASGSVTLLSLDGDNTVDVIHVKKYTHYVVSAVDSDNLQIYDEYGKSSICLKEKGKDISYKIIRKGSVAKFKNISVGSVLSVLASGDGTYYEINILANTVRGTVTAFDGEAYTIGEASYKRSCDLPESEKIELGQNGIFYLDIENNIIRVEADSAIDNTYAYLLNAKIATGLDNTLSFKLLNGKGEVVAVDASNKVKFAGEIKPASEIIALLGGEGSVTKQPIKYALNSEGKLIELELPALAFSKADRLYRSTKIFGYSGEAGGFLVNDEETTIFRVPDGGGADEEYSVVTSTNLGNRASYSVEAYDFEGLTAHCVVIYVASGSKTFNVLATDDCCIVKSVSKVIDEDGIEATRLVFLEQGKEKKLSIKTDATLMQVNLRENDPATGTYKMTPIKADELKVGDVFHYTVDALGNINGLGRIFPQEPTKSLDEQPEFIISRGWSFEKAWSKPQLVADGGMLLTIGGIDYLYSISKPAGAVYVCYAKSEIVKTGTSADILDVAHAGAAAPWVFVKTNTGLVDDIIIYYPDK